MPRKTQLFTQLPWKGGLNTATDPGVIPPDDLIEADNVIFAENSAKIRREGFEYFDSKSHIPKVLARKSSGTTRTLIFNEQLQRTNNFEKVVVDEKITVENNTSDYNGDFTIDSVTTETPSNKDFSDSDVDTSNDQITISSHGFYTGMEFKLTTTGSLPNPLSTGTDYYLIKVDNNTIQVASSESDALDGTAIDITDASGGGTHTVEPNTINNNAITYTASGSLSESIEDGSGSEDVSRNWKFIGLHDYWYVNSSGTKIQELVGISDEPKWYKYDTDGRRLEITEASGATSLSSPTRANFAVMNNKLIVGLDGSTNTPKKYDGASKSREWDDLGGSPPNFEVLRQHLGRLFTNDKDNKDRLHFSSPGAHEEWKGTGDSGGFDVFPQDGDPSGIIAIAPPFQGSLFISKKQKIIEMSGTTPVEFALTPITEGLGMTSHRAAVSIDFNDVFFLSDRGIHSLLTTARKGGFSSDFLSQKIQKSFNSFESGRLEYTMAAYIPQINSVAYNISRLNSNTHDEVWLYNIPFDAWYRWPSVSAEAMTSRLATNTRQKLVFGTNKGQIIQSQSGNKQDFGTNSVSYTVKTGQIYPDNNPATLKAFKMISLYFKPKGEFDITINASIDNFSNQSRNLNPNADVVNLGSTFELGSSILGTTGVLAPFSVTIDGIGRGIQLEITTTGGNQDIELYGFSIEYELMDIAQETT